MALTHIKETHRTRRSTDVVFEVALCEGCLARLTHDDKTAHGYDAKGYKREVMSWAGPARECSYCNGERPTAS